MNRPSFTRLPLPRNALPQVQCTDEAVRQEARLGPLPADHDQVARRSRAGGDGEGVGADDREAIALIEPAGAVVLVPDVEKDARHALEARVSERGVQQLPPDAAALNARLDIEAPQLLVAGRPAGRRYLDRPELRVADR